MPSSDALRRSRIGCNMPSCTKRRPQLAKGTGEAVDAREGQAQWAASSCVCARSFQQRLVSPRPSRAGVGCHPPRRRTHGEIRCGRAASACSTLFSPRGRAYAVLTVPPRLLCRATYSPPHTRAPLPGQRNGARHTRSRPHRNPTRAASACSGSLHTTTRVRGSLDFRAPPIIRSARMLHPLWRARGLGLLNILHTTSATRPHAHATRGALRSRRRCSRAGHTAAAAGPCRRARTPPWPDTR
jgi:hypothetical protein